ncbi:AP-3 complex subunit mu-2 [Perkinsus olseni]|uniref:AP-3 complex subunit mu-2 n=1 Tax=Perkinsus olseni TaxID=32597 RepID=A0A7J6PFS6_PEROL|nr:AP-3 complex subunit mu-2 [Perkinsus olseni]
MSSSSSSRASFDYPAGGMMSTVVNSGGRHVASSSWLQIPVIIIDDTESERTEIQSSPVNENDEMPRVSIAPVSLGREVPRGSCTTVDEEEFPRRCSAVAEESGRTRADAVLERDVEDEDWAPVRWPDICEPSPARRRRLLDRLISDLEAAWSPALCLRPRTHALSQSEMERVGRCLGELTRQKGPARILDLRHCTPRDKKDFLVSLLAGSLFNADPDDTGQFKMFRRVIGQLAGECPAFAARLCYKTTVLSDYQRGSTITASRSRGHRSDGTAAKEHYRYERSWWAQCSRCRKYRRVPSHVGRHYESGKGPVLAGEFHCGTLQVRVVGTKASWRRVTCEDSPDELVTGEVELSRSRVRRGGKAFEKKARKRKRKSHSYRKRKSI